MPVNTLPQRCPPTCDICHSRVAGGQFHFCPDPVSGYVPDSGSVVCCTCVPSTMHVEYLPPVKYLPVSVYGSTARFIHNLLYGSAIWNADTFQWEGVLNYEIKYDCFNLGGFCTPELGTLTFPMVMYLERVDGECFFVLQSDILGFPVGYEKRIPISGTSEDCKKLNYLEEGLPTVYPYGEPLPDCCYELITEPPVEIGTTSTLRITGSQISDHPKVSLCYPQCCIPFVCYQLVVNGSVHTFDTTNDEPLTVVPFQSTIVFTQSEVWHKQDLAFRDNLPASVCNLRGSDTNVEFAGTIPCSGNENPFYTDTSIIRFDAEIYANTLHLTGTFSGYSGGTVWAQYTLSPFLVAGVPCTEKTLTQIDYLEGVGTLEHAWFMVCATDDAYVGRNDITSWIEITSVSNLTLNYDCFSEASACRELPGCLTFIIRGIIGVDCEDCNVQLAVMYRQINTCIWYGYRFINSCFNVYGAESGQWIAVYDPATETWTASLELFDYAGNPLGSLVSYTFSGDFNVLPWIAEYVTSSGDCTWPSIIAVYECTTINTTWGACCQTVGSGSSISICAMMTAEECASLDGNFLGNGTRCWLEGCSICAIDCNTFCDVYELYVSINNCACWDDATPSGTIAFTQDMERNYLGIGPCAWAGEFGIQQVRMDIDTSVSPPVRTLTLDLLSDDANTTIHIEASQTADAYCEAENVNFKIDVWESAGAEPCAQPADTDVVLRVTKKSGCPDLDILIGPNLS